MCKKALPGLEPRCRSCQADVSLLVDYVKGLDGGLARAAALARAGELGEAVWAYLEVLEVDPENAEARRQVGQVAAAVRQFDRAAPGRRWQGRLLRQARFRRWLAAWQRREAMLPGWMVGVLCTLLAGAALLLGYAFGYSQGARHIMSSPAPAESPER
jgi:hypothetical protein